MPAPYALHWVCDSPTPYYQHMFNALAADPTIDLMVHYVNKTSAAHPWRRSHMAPAHRTFRTVMGIDLRIIRVAAGRRSRLVVAGWSSPALVALLLELAALGRSYVFYTDTPNLTRWRNPVRRVARLALARMIFRTATAVMSTGTPGVEALRAMGCPGDKAVDFPLFCDIDALRRPDGVRLGGGPLRLASCGRLVARKAYDRAFHAVGRLKQHGVAFRYDIAGTGSEEPRLRALAGRLGIGANVHFRGWLEAEDTHTLLKSCDIFLHPATTEPYGVVVLEAMAAGAAVLGSDACGAVQDRIVHDRNGLIHRAGDGGVLAEQLLLLARERARIRELGAAAEATAREWPVERACDIVKGVLARVDA